MVSDIDRCGEPSCSKQGKSICSACNSIKYCSTECQKNHWATHKIQCKEIKKKNKASGNNTTAVASSNTVQTASSNTSNDFNNKLQGLKQEISKLFQIGDFKSAIKLGNDSIILAKLLPEPASSIELFQLNLNISNAYMQMNDPANAEVYINNCVDDAERGVSIRPGQPQAIEMLSVALGSRALWLTNANRLPEAYTAGSRSYDLALSIYGPEDSRLYKALRCLALIYEKQNNLNEMEKSFKRSYDLINSNVQAIQETHILTEEFIQHLIKHSMLDTALNYAQLFYNNFTNRINVNEMKQNEQLILGDQTARLSSILCRLNRLPEGEKYMLESLALREKALGPESKAVGSTLISLASIYEATNKPINEIEKLLQRAYEIFKKIEGPNGYLSTSTYEQIKRLRNKQRDLKNNEIDNIVTNVTSENSLKQKKFIPTTDDLPMFESNDGFGRMKLASQLFESNQFSKAQILLAEAYKIFLKQLGPDHSTTKAAKQNLEVVKQNSINQLWKELADEMIEKLSISDENTENGSAKVEDDSWLFKEPEKTHTCIIS